MEIVRWWQQKTMDVLKLYEQADRKTCRGCRHGQNLDGFVTWCDKLNAPTTGVGCLQHDPVGGREQ